MIEGTEGSRHQGMIFLACDHPPGLIPLHTGFHGVQEGWKMDSFCCTWQRMAENVYAQD